MKVIETEYDGYRFRSRLEARWAVFFKTLGVKYEYEPEGFDLDGTWYLPDFWLPDLQYWIEIKGQDPTKDECMKASLLTMMTDHPVYIFPGGIWLPGVDDTREVNRHDGKVVEVENKGAFGYSSEYANIYGRDVTSPCYKGACPHESHFPLDDDCGCPYSHYIGNKGEEGKLVRALYIAEMQHSHGDSCHLQLAPDNTLQFFRPAFKRKDGKDRLLDYEKLPIPQSIQEHYEAFVAFFRRFSSDWQWHIGGFSNTLYSEDVYRWCECSYCRKLGIVPFGDEKYMPCHREHKKKYARKYEALGGCDRTNRLVDAYTAARQARFEHQ